MEAIMFHKLFIISAFLVIFPACAMEKPFEAIKKQKITEKKERLKQYDGQLRTQFATLTKKLDKEYSTPQPHTDKEMQQGKKTIKSLVHVPVSDVMLYYFAKLGHVETALNTIVKEAKNYHTAEAMLWPVLTKSEISKEDMQELYRKAEHELDAKFFPAIIRNLR